MSWEQIKSDISTAANGAILRKTDCLIICADAEVAINALPALSIDCIVTSPPYGKLKDYGATSQIGFGQDPKNEYFPAIQRVLTALYRVTKEGGALWVVADNWKENGELIALPWEIITRARQAGWKLHDFVTWDKGKSLPWSHSGRFRRTCEYIILLGKGKLRTFDMDAVREVDHLSPYWIRYPERYNPSGKAPSNLWHFPIPTQGSWSNSAIQHFCPFPLPLVARMISVSTCKSEVILDPFCGTGTVPVMASHLGRNGLGIEINSDFVENIRKVGYDRIITDATREIPNEPINRRYLGRTIVKLRALKFPKTLFTQLSRPDRLGPKARKRISGFVVEQVGLIRKTSSNKALASVRISILLRRNVKVAQLDEAIRARVQEAPLSKFGLQVAIDIVPFSRWSKPDHLSKMHDGYWFVYTNGKFHSYETRRRARQISSALRNRPIDKSGSVPPIVSPMRLDIESAPDGG